MQFESHLDFKKGFSMRDDYCTFLSKKFASPGISTNSLLLSDIFYTSAWIILIREGDHLQH